MTRYVPTSITMPPDLRRWLEDYSKTQTRNLSQQIVHMLSEARARIEAKEDEAA